MISAIFISTPRGDILLYRAYKDDITRQDASEFVQRLILSDKYKEVPTIRHRRWVYAKVSINFLTLCCVVRHNGNVTRALTCLIELRQLIHVVVGEKVTNDSVMNNILTIYEIMDEIIDGGCIQNMEKVALANFSVSEFSARLLLNNSSFVQYSAPTDDNIPNLPDVPSFTNDFPIAPQPKPIESPLFVQKEDPYESFNQTYLAATSFAILKGADVKHVKNASSFNVISNTSGKHDADLNLGTAMATGEMVPWRIYGLDYRKNEIILTVSEVLNVYYNLAGSLVDCHIIGNLEVNSYISGSPELTLGANFSVDNISYGGIYTLPSKELPSPESSRNYTIFEHVKFHKSVQLNSAYTGCICFIPPDGQFTLFTYRSTDKIVHPLKITAVVHKRSSIHLDYAITIKWLLGKKLTGTGIVATLPIPPSSKNVDIYNVSTGNAKVEMSKNVVEWKIKKLCGEQELTMRCGTDFTASPIGTQWKQLPLHVKFEIAGYAPSGIFIKNIDSTEKIGLKLNKRINYHTMGNYHVHIKR
ncbi:Adaptor complexes medium subunit family [Babesia microti strain RI]|uniref:Adaptor complexes medium subunit family n=1 Tax=Babesia microti (strain RI) TaxID=1133968 RepID=A0A0K3ATC6_BABMR|nr:Adaptor complexes medium subunit family [Babesia microti strain RI]CTQ40816.1 Adaptor complexes medium subunit family [Babesia microti strain RI]|eukprot:XP_012648827.1 Adaptor complexes medium subunit family [Babesia microti strain RI]